MGHTGELALELEGKDVLFMSGRIHAYEGIVKMKWLTRETSLWPRYKNLLLLVASGEQANHFLLGTLRYSDQINLTAETP